MVANYLCDISGLKTNMIPLTHYLIETPFTGMRTVSHSKSGKYVGWLQNGEKQFLNHLLKV